jgi:hypothetical protein
MKKFFCSFIAFLLMSTIMFSCILPVAALLNESNYIAYVWADGDYDNGTYHSNIKNAWDDASIRGNLLLLSDWKTEKTLATKRYKTTNIYMNGFSIDRALDTPQKNGEVFLVTEKSSLKIYGGNQADINAKSSTAKITGGYSTNTAGGIQVQENSGLYLYGVSITGNKTTDTNGGGGIRLQNDNSRIEMNEYTYISNNEAINSSGGGISVQGLNCLIVGGNIIDNNAEKNGGGILINKKMYAFETRLDKIAAEDAVEYPYASASQEWNGNSALLMAIPTLIRPIITVSGTVYSPFAAKTAMDS